MKKNINFICTTLALLLLVANFILLVDPTTTSFTADYKYTLDALKQKQRDLDTENRTYEDNIRVIKDKNEQLIYVQEQLEDFRKMKQELLPILNSISFEEHIPSVLIILDQKAKELEVELLIDYNNMKSDGGAGGRAVTPPTPEPPAGGNPDASPSPNQDENSEPGTSQKSNPKQVSLPGFNTTTLPVAIKGTYSNVSKYIEAIDELDLIETHYLKLVSEGNLVTASMALNIYSTEGGF